MGKRRNSGFLETLVKSVLGVGTTVKNRKTFWGRDQKVVKHHDTGKQKTYTHGYGIFGNATKTFTTKGGRVIEQGRLNKNFLWGATEHAKRPDGTFIRRSYQPGITKDHVSTLIEGECNVCNGSGRFTGPCRNCAGTGIFHLNAKPCFSCSGIGVVNGTTCNHCRGTGQHKPAADVLCRRCDGTGTFSTDCKKCGGTGQYKRFYFE